MFIIIRTPAPILNTPDFHFAFGGTNGKEIPLNTKGQPYCFEFVALPGMLFEVLEQIPKPFGSINRVACAHYPQTPLYIDSRFTMGCTQEALSQPKDFSFKTCPSTEIILSRMKQKVGTPYVWGGNWSAGIPELLTYYPPKEKMDPSTEILWTLKGVDCSGLLYEAAEGKTPRNTCDLLQNTMPVPIEEKLKPLDMILYPGHVIFILDEMTTIESTYPLGVVQTELSLRLKKLEQERSRVSKWTSETNKNANYIISRFSQKPEVKSLKKKHCLKMRKIILGN